MGIYAYTHERRDVCHYSNRMRREALRDPGLPSGGRAAVPKRQEDWKVVVLKPRFL